MYSGGFTVRTTDWLSFGLKGSTNLTDTATNDDFDFDLGFCPPSSGGHTECHSNSPSLLRNADSLDLSARGTFLAIPGFNLAGVAGYKYDYYKWQAYGGTFNYGPSSPGLDPLPPGLGLTYEQTWKTPYIGLEANGRSGKFDWHGRIIGSNWVNGSAVDHHQVGNAGVTTIYHDSFGTSSMIEASVGAGYDVGEGVSVTANYTYKNYMTAKGDENQNFGGVFDNGNYGFDCSGGNNISQLFAVGLNVDLSRDKELGKHLKQKRSGWAGGYAGGSTGRAWQASQWTLNDINYPLAGGVIPPLDPTTTPASFDTSGASVDSFAGYGMQSGKTVFGLEGDVGHWNLSQTQSGIPGTLLVFGLAPLSLASDATSVQATSTAVFAPAPVIW